MGRPAEIGACRPYRKQDHLRMGAKTVNYQLKAIGLDSHRGVASALVSQFRRVLSLDSPIIHFIGRLRQKNIALQEGYFPSGCINYVSG